MPKSNVLKLIHSLSKPEKRRFKLVAKKQSGNKMYLDMFDLIVHKKIMDETTLSLEFEKHYDASSTSNTARYLSELVIDSLIQARIKKQDFYQLLYGLLKVNILKERNLLDDSYSELKKIQHLTYNPGNALLQYLVLREQLNYLSGSDFEDSSEKDLVSLQMKARQILKKIRNTHEHYSLLELLKYRTLKTDKVLSDKEKEKLNDLLLSEMSIVNDRVKNNLESKRLHLLFQSFFFSNIGDYKSALRTYSELNLFFERNPEIWTDPPLDYYSSLDGILDSLRTDGLFNEMDFYIKKLVTLDNPEYPEYFNYLTRKTTLVYRLASGTKTADKRTALQIISEYDTSVWETYPLIDEKKQKELLFSLALAYFEAKKFKQSEKFIGSAFLIGNSNQDSVILKAIRLLDLLINYEKREFVYLDYQIRSYKRNTNGKGRILKTERLIYKVLKMNPDFNGRVKNEFLWQSLHTQVLLIERSKYEHQLLKYFDFVEWSRKKFI